MKRALLLLLLVSLGALSAQARLGETLKQLTERNGRPQPQAKKDKNAAVWLIEGEDGQLVFTVTFDQQGRSIAEGIKPVRYAKFSDAMAKTFIASQLSLFPDSKTLQKLSVGGKYVFGGKSYVVEANERVLVDDANDIMIVWNRGATPSVIAVRAAMLK